MLALSAVGWAWGPYRFTTMARYIRLCLAFSTQEMCIGVKQLSLLYIQPRLWHARCLIYQLATSDLEQGVAESKLSGCQDYGL